VAFKLFGDKLRQMLFEVLPCHDPAIRIYVSQNKLLSFRPSKMLAANMK